MKNIIEFNFSGFVKEQYVKEICSQWANEFKINPSRKFTLIFNAEKLEDYETKARILVQNCIKENKNQIEEIYLISESKVAIGGAMLMSMFVGIKIKAIKSKSELPNTILEEELV